MVAVWTVGHSTHTIEDFVGLLRAHGIEIVADVRRYPGSRRNPQFGQAALATALNRAGIRYEHFVDLGGRREPQPDSHNIAWRNPAFRGYADYMETEAFRSVIDHLLAVAAERRTALMCAEALWWNCHRSLISDYLKSVGADVWHILDAANAEPHAFTAAARIVEGSLSYEGRQGSLFE